MGKSKKKHESSDSDSSEDSSSSSSSSASSEDESELPPKKSRYDSARKKKEKKKEKKKKRKLKKKLKKERSKMTVEKISKEDFYSRNSEFRAWIKGNLKIKKAFGDMETTEAKRLFAKFVRKWNSKKLAVEFYQEHQGITPAGQGATGSEFQWAFAQNMDAKTKSEIEAVRKDEGPSGEPKGRQGAGSVSESAPPPPPRVIGPAIPDHIAQALNQDSDSEDEQDRFEREMKEKRFKDYVKTANDELCPRAGSGFEARMEKKAMERERKRQRDTSPGLSDKVLLGDSSNMGKAIERRKEQREVEHKASVAKAREKLATYAAKEKAKMDALMEMAKATKKDGALWNQ